MCQPIVMMLKEPFEAELTSTIGPGSRNRRIPSNGYDRFRYARFMEVLSHVANPFAIGDVNHNQANGSLDRNGHLRHRVAMEGDPLADVLTLASARCVRIGTLKAGGT